MRHYIGLCLLAGMASLASTESARADVFTWNPRALQLNGAKFSADSFSLGDYARIVFTDAQGHFLDNGTMPILGFTLGGQVVKPSGFGGAFGSNSGWGAYIAYSGSGTQYVDPATGLPAATYSSLQYTLYGYNGTATFSDAGLPNIAGSQIALFSGDLIRGSLQFTPVSFDPLLLEIDGTADTTVVTNYRQFSSDKFVGLDVNFVHPPGEYIQQGNQIVIPGGGTSSNATFFTAKVEKRTALFAAVAAAVTEVPEPATLLLLPGLLLGSRLIRRKELSRRV